jgi:60 kDa SS-A/Ro ribonucleoprotein
MTRLASHLNPSNTPQTEALKGQVANSAAGFSYPVDDWTRLDRFLVLGSEGGSYYASERKLTLENADAVRKCLKLDSPRAVSRIVEVSLAGRAVKNEPAIMALVLALKEGDEATRKRAADVLPQVCRIGTHLFQAAEYVKALGGWGRNTTRAFEGWYLGRRPASLASQVIKYQSREGWSHRDVLRKCHAKTANPTTNAVLHYAVKGWESVGEQPHDDEALRQIWAFERAKKADRKELVRLISEYGLPHECVPNEAKSDPAVWEAMLPTMGLTALMRNLNKLTAVGLLAPLQATTKKVCDLLTDEEALKAARVHPLKMLVALRTYAQGHGDKGKLTWKPVQQVVSALDAGFYKAFKAVEPTGKRHLLALDVSGSMTWGAVAGCGGMTPRDISAVLALVTMNVEDQTLVKGFSHDLCDIPISPRKSLGEVVNIINQVPMGGTDCSLPMEWAIKTRTPVDAFVVYTDSETYLGTRHPSVALQDYRQKTGIPAKLVVVGMVSNGFTIADPKDGGMMDVVGADTHLPSIIADFVR